MQHLLMELIDKNVARLKKNTNYFQLCHQAMVKYVILKCRVNTSIDRKGKIMKIITFFSLTRKISPGQFTSQKQLFKFRSPWSFTHGVLFFKSSTPLNSEKEIFDLEIRVIPSRNDRQVVWQTFFQFQGQNNCFLLLFLFLNNKKERTVLKLLVLMKVNAEMH